ncbi:MAG: hypothetical protein OSA39_10865, partial [Sphingobium sp.]|nr:hypothetical protein [Sphingobium sp.]
LVSLDVRVIDFNDSKKVFNVQIALKAGKTEPRVLQAKLKTPSPWSSCARHHLLSRSTPTFLQPPACGKYRESQSGSYLLLRLHLGLPY